MAWIFLSVLAICLCVVVKAYIEKEPKRECSARHHHPSKNEFANLERHVRQIDLTVGLIVRGNQQVRESLPASDPFRMMAERRLSERED